jgi:hypothetical protein
MALTTEEKTLFALVPVSFYAAFPCLGCSTPWNSADLLFRMAQLGAVAGSDGSRD